MKTPVADQTREPVKARRAAPSPFKVFSYMAAVAFWNALGCGPLMVSIVVIIHLQQSSALGKTLSALGGIAALLFAVLWYFSLKDDALYALKAHWRNALRAGGYLDE